MSAQSRESALRFPKATQYISDPRINDGAPVPLLDGLHLTGEWPEFIKQFPTASKMFSRDRGRLSI